MAILMCSLCRRAFRRLQVRGSCVTQHLPVNPRCTHLHCANHHPWPQAMKNIRSTWIVPASAMRAVNPKDVVPASETDGGFSPRLWTAAIKKKTHSPFRSHLFIGRVLRPGSQPAPSRTIKNSRSHMACV
uniref:C2H2-type domain-containing protein n=1 Tax=Panagrellus redivivus TaxID=6233 RepID=A0A7E4VK27_PANRE